MYWKQFLRVSSGFDCPHLICCQADRVEELREGAEVEYLRKVAPVNGESLLGLSDYRYFPWETDCASCRVAVAVARFGRCCCRGHRFASLDLHVNLSVIITCFKRTFGSVCHSTEGGLPNGQGGTINADLRNIVTVCAPVYF